MTQRLGTSQRDWQENTADRDRQHQQQRATIKGKHTGMGRTLRQAKKRQQGSGHAEPEARNSSTADRDMDGPNGVASSPSGDRRLAEMPQDRREKDDGQTGDRGEQDGTKDTATCEAEGIRRGTNNRGDTNMHASRVGGQQ